MSHASLFAISPLDGRYADKLSQFSPIYSEFGLFKYRVLVEIEWLIALANHTEITEIKTFSESEQQFLRDIFTNFSIQDALRIKEIEKITNHDVKAVEYFLKEKIAPKTELAVYAEFLHFACTSEDINNLAYALMLKEAKKQVLLPALEALVQALKNMAQSSAHIAMLSRTHGQAATPTTLGKELANFVYRLQNALIDFQQARLAGKFNGAVGNFNAHSIAYPHINWLVISQTFVGSLNLNWNPYTTQIENHDYLAENFAPLMRFNSILIDLARDFWAYISLAYFKQKHQAQEVGSSTMPHKINPIDFENAEGNLLMANTLLQFLSQQLLTSRFQRDLVDSTLLRNVGVALGHCLIAYQSLLKGLNKCEINKDCIQADLESHWEVLTEAVQTVMRRYGLAEPYEQLKALSRGEKLTQAKLAAFIQEQALPPDVKNTLLQLRPETYVGYAAQLAEKISK